MNKARIVWRSSAESALPLQTNYPIYNLINYPDRDCKERSRSIFNSQSLLTISCILRSEI